MNMDNKREKVTDGAYQHMTHNHWHLVNQADYQNVHSIKWQGLHLLIVMKKPCKLAQVKSKWNWTKEWEIVYERQLPSKYPLFFRFNRWSLLRIILGKIWCRP